MRNDFVDFMIEQGTLTEEHCEWIKKAWRPPAEPIGSIAFSHGLLSGEDVDRILEHQRESHQPFGRIATELGLLDAKQIEMLLEIQQMRSAIETAEAVALADICPLPNTFEKLGQFLTARFEAMLQK
jgi:hypothetical protein